MPTFPLPLEGAKTILAEVDRLRASNAELLAALEGVLKGFEEGDFKRAHPRQSDDDPYHPALVAARAAIAKATDLDASRAR